MTHALFRVLPALDSLRRYRLADLRGDVVAGLTVATVAVPQAMAYGMVAGVPPQYGLYTAIVMTAVGAVLASSKQLINGPTNVISIAVLSALATLPAAYDKVQAAMVLALMVGTIQLGITFLRLGDLTRYISHSVIVGFTLGAGTLLVLDQVKNLLGLSAASDPHAHFLVRFWSSITQGGGVHPQTAAVGLGTIGLVLLLRWMKARIGWTFFPDLLLTVVLSAWLTARLGLDEAGVRVIGEIPATLPTFQVPYLDYPLVQHLSGNAFAIATLGLLEALAMAKSLASQTGEKLDLNQQCLSEGLANFAGGLFQCIPGSGSLTRSAINQQAGAASQWSGVISAIAVALIVVAFSQYARFIPRATLAGILMVSAWRMIDHHSLLYHLRATRFDATVVWATAIAAVAVSVEFCVLIGVFCSFLLTVPRLGQMLLTEFVVTSDGTIHERMSEEPVCEKIRVYGLEGEMFFGSSGAMEQHFEAIEQALGPGTEVLVLRVKRFRNPDAVGMHLLEDFIARLHARGVQVLLCGIRPDFHEALYRTGAAKRLHADHLFPERALRNSSTTEAVRFAYTLISAPCPACPRGDPLLRREGGLYYVV